MSLIHQQEIENVAADSNCDVIVIGAGPAGATAAYYLAQHKFRVILIDKKHFPREKICGDFVSPGSIKELRKMGVTNSEAFNAANLVDRARIFLSGKELVAGVFPQIQDMPRYSKVVSREILDSLIVEAARAVGVRVLEGFNVSEYQANETGVTVTASDTKSARRFHARLLIGADGNNSVVARTLSGKPWPKTETALVARGYYTEVEGLANEANVFYGNDSFPGYSWLFPTGKNEANVGVGIVLGADPPAETPENLLRRLISTDEGMRSRLGHAKLVDDIEVSPLNLHDSQQPLAGDRVMLVGEAAGLINPFNGEGIQMGLLSGRWAAETAVSCGGDFSRQRLAAYEKRVQDELGYGFGVAALMLGLLRNRNLNHAWLRWIQLMGEKSKADPEYAKITSGILSGMIFPNQEAAAKALLGTLEEAAVSTGVRTVAEALNDPFKVPQSAENAAKIGFQLVSYAAQDPFAALKWGMDAGVNLLGIVSALPKRIIEEKEKVAESQQP